jgi:LPXTG-site transpeptidase (sortase) family protein
MLEPVALTGVPTPTLTRYGLGQIPYTTVLANVSPGADGTAAIAGHRTTHGAPFRHLDLLQPGDLILVRKGPATQQWQVSDTAVIAPTDVNAIRSRPGVPRLVLLACTPPFSAKSRLMVVAQPVTGARVLADAVPPPERAELSSRPAALERAAVSRDDGRVPGRLVPSSARGAAGTGAAVPYTPPRVAAQPRAGVHPGGAPHRTYADSRNLSPRTERATHTVGVTGRPAGSRPLFGAAGGRARSPRTYAPSIPGPRGVFSTIAPADVWSPVTHEGRESK